MDGKKCTQSTKTSVLGDFTIIQPFHDICSMLGSVLCRVLPAAHALTGCGTTFSFFGVVKNTMYKVLKDSQKGFVDPNYNGGLTGG
jgi:hypothetical protein